MTKIGLVGYGRLGCQIQQMLMEKIGTERNEYFLFDDLEHQKKTFNSFPFSDHLDSVFCNLTFYVCLGYKNLPLKSKIISDLLSKERKVPNLIHPTSYVHHTVKVGSGSIIYPMCNVDYEVQLGNGVLLNNSSTVSHESQIGEGTYISPGVVISGGVKIGKHCFLGTGTHVTNDISIGNGVKAGIGTVITKNISDRLSVIGNPYRILENELRIS